MLASGGGLMLLFPRADRLVPFDDASDVIRSSDQLRARMQESGYVYLRGFVPDARVGDVRAFVRDYGVRMGWLEPDANNGPTLVARAGARLQRRGWDDPDWIALTRAVNADACFRALCEFTPLLDLLETLLGEPGAPAATNFCWLKLPGTPEHTTLPHQDVYYLRECPRVLTVWVALVDTPMEVGPLGVVPGSAKLGLWHHENTTSGATVPADTTWASNAVRAGDVVVFDAHTIHCAWSNVSPRLARLSADLRYEPQSITPSVLRPTTPFPSS
jgi:ectoine hydroxylase-related dioxygenase (phytanoyl-CoA dioxygenase family)